MTENIAEFWMPVKGYEDLYRVSNLSRVFRIGGSVKRGDHTLYVPEKEVFGSDNGKGYIRVKLTRNNKCKSTMVHRIVAEAFIPNPENKKCVNHKNGIKADNSIDNLEWVTHSENVHHAMKTGLIDMDAHRIRTRNIGLKTIKNIYGWNSRPVIDSSTGKKFNSVTHAAKELGLNRRHLHDMLVGKSKNKTTLTIIA